MEEVRVGSFDLALLLPGFAVLFVLLGAATPYLASLADISMRRANS
jgi:hypothetical protein